MERPSKLDWSALLTKDNDLGDARMQNDKMLTDWLEECLDGGTKLSRDVPDDEYERAIESYVQKWVGKHSWQLASALGTKVTEEHLCEVLGDQLWKYRPYSKNFTTRTCLLTSEIFVYEVDDETVEPASLDEMTAEHIDTADRRLAGVGIGYGFICTAPFIIVDNVPIPFTIEALHEAIDETDDEEPIVKVYIAWVDRDAPLPEHVEE